MRVCSPRPVNFQQAVPVRVGWRCQAERTWCEADLLPDLLNQTQQRLDPTTHAHLQTTTCPLQKHHRTSSKRAKRILEASQRLSSLYARSRPAPHRRPSHLLIFTYHCRRPPHPSPPNPQNDVEEYLGGPDAAVERVLSAFQDALACVSLHNSR